MKKINLIILLLGLTVNSFSADTWDIIDKSMSAWNIAGGADNNKAWTSAQQGTGITITQEPAYVNITKTSIATSNNYAFLVPPALTLSANTAYSLEIKARVKPVNKTTYPDLSSGFESNQISARLNSKNMAVHLKYGNENDGYVSLKGALTHDAEDKFMLNTSEWHVYRFVFYPDNSIYDVYIDDIDEPVFENVPTAVMSGSNILRLGAESTHRCNLDIEYAKMGTGAFFSKAKIVSVSISADTQAEEKATTLIVTANTILIPDHEKLSVSLVDGEDNTVIDGVEAVVSQNKAVVDFTIPAGLPRGKYFVKAFVPAGKIGDVDIAPGMAEYLITSSAFEGKNLATFGNSITAAANSWAYQVHKKLRFANLYNGAISAAIWYKRERVVAGQTLRTQNYYDADFAGISSVPPTGEDLLAHQKRINNCAVVHIQKYFTELNKKTTPVPDVIILSYGTNDELFDYTMGDAETALKETDLRKVNIFTMAGALRWCIDTLRMELPRTKIYVALPLQSARDGKNEGNLIKMEIMKKICDARSVPYFDCFHESGITLENQASYLGDGLHPNEAGKIVHGEYIMKKLEESNPETGLPFIFRQEVSDRLVSISPNVLNAGQYMLVKSLITESSLSEAILYDFAGHAVYRKSVSGDEFTFDVPAFSGGLYVLNVKLDDNRSNGFKVLIR